MGQISDKQFGIAEISEMIHTASLLHDDVIDQAETRRGSRSVSSLFGNKLAILAGDFLLSRASRKLARLESHRATDLMSEAIECLVKGEVIQIRNGQNAQTVHERLRNYNTKNYYKTAALIANSCRCVAILGSHGQKFEDIAYEFGKHLGLAFQVVDDLLDVTGSSETLGKPALRDMQQGLATAPVLFAALEHEELTPLINRKFSRPGDDRYAMELLRESNGIDKARELVVFHAEKALAALLHLPPSRPRAALVSLVEKVVNRNR
eukprot:GABV01000755.1.p1 GENE.GABV01000755.1~~GABV01000755.1.p1  ORF type:complete len:265 (-),score=75.60 GABV01000755.1:43-837(-)